MTKAELRKLQTLIDATAAAHGEAHRMANRLNVMCLQIYGCEPGDIDADEIIDAVLGGCGIASGMDAAEFDAIMRRAK